MKYQYATKGTCSRVITIDVEDGIVKSVEFFGGCHGNLQGIAKLVQGMKVEDVISRLEGIDCGGKGTSCPDQLSCALKQIAAC
ncbi:MAG: TIGR03905 family TSCPD domain-containing protein [Bacteroidales bacterium]|nr:TIGR03905 family TSCPD domain-containing protein [Bacteroidales bacterium]